MEHVMYITVRSTEVDTLGHVNNAKYLEYMEWARFEWMIQQGLPMEELQRRGILPVVANINVNYLREVRMLEQLKVVSKPWKRGEKSFVIRHELYNARNEQVCHADTTMVMMDARTRKSTTLPEEIARVFETVC